MKRTIVFENDGLKATVTLTPNKEKAIIEAVLNFYDKYGAWSGESIMQTDEPQINAAPFLADLVDDIIKPDVTDE